MSTAAMGHEGLRYTPTPTRQHTESLKPAQLSVGSVRAASQRGSRPRTFGTFAPIFRGSTPPSSFPTKNPRSKMRAETANIIKPDHLHLKSDKKMYLTMASVVDSHGSAGHRRCLLVCHGLAVVAVAGLSVSPLRGPAWGSEPHAPGLGPLPSGHSVPAGLARSR